MKIICPDCQKENKIVVKDGTNCRHCEASLDQYKFLKPIIPAFMLLLMGIGGTQAANHYLVDSRYPAELEYALIEQCSSSDNSLMRWEVPKIKNEVCLCALDKTQEEWTYSEANDEPNQFILAFNKNLSICVGK